MVVKIFNLYFSARRKSKVKYQNPLLWFFIILENNNLISSKISKRMQAMVGFRNIAVHNYRSLNLDIIIEIVENHLNDFTEFITQIIK
ncbi:MAG: type VII toxin-antitoxin system HepT family RNase toxin [bacterium]